MNFKILEPDDNPPVLLYRDVDTDDDEIVITKVYLSDLVNEQSLPFEEITSFKTEWAAARFIADFSVTSAYDFCMRAKQNLGID